MTPSSDAQLSASSSSLAEQGMELPRLFHFDLPRLKQTGQPFPEQSAISSIHRVLDVASGNGEWTINAAQALPQVQFAGIERNAWLVDRARAQAKEYGVTNATFTVMDPFGPLDLPDETFDLVNARYIAGLLEAAAWPNTLQEFTRVTRTGGVIRLTENDLPISNTVAFAQLGGLISDALYETKRSFSSNGQLLSITPALKRLLQDAGSQEVQQEVWYMNFSAGMPAHAELCQKLSETYRLVQPFLIRAGVTTPEAVEQTYQQMLSEMQSDDFCAGAFSLTVWGTKP
jgi:ubiquinone/menaquinone biosynthesis C-methylase UbiE